MALSTLNDRALLSARLVRIGIVLSLALVGLSCSDDGSTSTASEAAAPHVTSTTVQARQATTTTSTPPSDGSVEQYAGRLDPGHRYAFAVKPGLTLAVEIPPTDRPWTVMQDPDGVFFVAPTTGAIDVTTLEGTSLGRGTGPPGAVDAYQPDPAAPAPDIFSYLPSIPGMAVGEPAPIAIGAVEGRIAAFEVGDIPGGCTVWGGGPDCVVILSSPAGELYLMEGDRGELLVLPTPQGTLLVMWQLHAEKYDQFATAYAEAVRRVEFVDP
jgi:hypothetical protein